MLPTADERVTQSRWTFIMAWAHWPNCNLVQSIQDLDTAVNVVTLGQMNEAVQEKQRLSAHSGVPTPFTPCERR